ncbi:hypothetical protein MY1884_008751 [Beauveria asiatica]
MSAAKVNPSIEEIPKHYDYKPEQVERVNPRLEALPLAIAEPKPEWPRRFAMLDAKIRAALGDTALTVTHVGSTSVPGGGAAHLYLNQSSSDPEWGKNGRKNIN